MTSNTIIEVARMGILALFLWEVFSFSPLTVVFGRGFVVNSLHYVEICSKHVLMRVWLFHMLFLASVEITLWFLPCLLLMLCTSLIDLDI